MDLNVLWPFLAVPRVSLQCVIVVFSHHTHLLFHTRHMLKYYSLSVHDLIIFAIQENWTQMAVSLHVKRVLSYTDGNSRCRPQGNVFQ